MSNHHRSADSPLAGHEEEEFLSRILFGVTFLVLLSIAVSASAIGVKWRAWFPGTEHFTSLFEGVRAAANSVIPLMFMK
jgi:hypothetical protein